MKSKHTKNYRRNIPKGILLKTIEEIDVKEEECFCFCTELYSNNLPNAK